MKKLKRSKASQGKLQRAWSRKTLTTSNEGRTEMPIKKLLKKSSQLLLFHHVICCELWVKERIVLGQAKGNYSHSTTLGTHTHAQTVATGKQVKEAVCLSTDLEDHNATGF